MKEAVWVNMGEFDGDNSMVRTHDLPIDLHAEFTAGSGQQKSNVAYNSRLQIRPNGQEAAADAKIADLLSGVCDIVDPHFGLNPERDSRESSLFARHT